METKTKPMTPERIEQLRHVVDYARRNRESLNLAIQVYVDHLAACLAEIDRLRAWLESIEAITEDQNGPRRPELWLLDAAWESARDALAGEAAPQ